MAARGPAVNPRHHNDLQLFGGSRPPRPTGPKQTAKEGACTAQKTPLELDSHARLQTLVPAAELKILLAGVAVGPKQKPPGPVTNLEADV